MMFQFPEKVIEKACWPYRQVSLGCDADHQKGFEGHQDVLEGVPGIGEEEDEHLVLDVKVEALDVDEEGDDEEDVDDGEGDEGVVEGGLHLRPEEDQDGRQVPHHPHYCHHGQANLRKPITMMTFELRMRERE